MLMRGILMLLCGLLASPGWAFPDNPVFETFTGADNTSPPNANWTNAVISGATSANVEIDNNAATSAGGATEGDAYYNVAQFNADAELYGDVVDTANTTEVTLCLRLANIGANTTDGYCVYWNDAATDVVIGRFDNGAFTALATINQTITVGDKFGIRTTGSRIGAWYKVGAGDWTEIGFATDTTYTAGGYAGIAIAGSATVEALDNVGGGNAAALQSPPLPSILFE